MNEHASVSALERPIHATSWGEPDTETKWVKTPSLAKTTTLRKLAKAIRTRRAVSKDFLPLIKLSAFGDVATDKGWLRHEANLLDMYGAELDYDDEVIPVDEAAELLLKANIACLVYTSPSHTPDTPRWRVLLPFSQSLPQDQRGLLLGRVAGVFHAAYGANPFSRESWTPAQCYYYGCVAGNEDGFVVHEIDGQCIDQLDHLDNEHWQQMPATKVRKDARGRPVIGAQGEIDWVAVEQIIAEFGHGVHQALLSLAGRMVGEGMTWDDIYDDLTRRLKASAGSLPFHPRHKRWKGVVDDRRKEISNIITDCFRKEKANHPLLSKASDRDTPGSGSAHDDAKKEQDANNGGGDEAGIDEDAKTHDDEPKATRPKPRAWTQLLQANKKGFLSNEFNVITTLAHAPPMAGALAYDSFRCRYMLMRRPPWGGSETYPRQWTDNDDAQCAAWLQKEGLQARPRTVPPCMMVVAAGRTFNPLTDWLTSLTWDRTPRVDTWLVDFMGAENLPVNREIGRRFLLSCVARAMEPGCKVDTMMVLEGPQGGLKSTALRALAGKEFFTDEIHDVGSKDAAMQLAGVWLVELSELDALSKAQVSLVKAWLSRTTDRYRPPYGRALVEQPRGCVIVGSTNHDDYLIDATGGRRFWPVKVGRIDIGGLAEMRDQIWAETLDRYRDKEPWWVVDKHMQKAIAEAQGERLTIHDAWRETIEEYLQRTDNVTVNEIMTSALQIEEVVKRDRRTEMVVANLLLALGWKKRRTARNGVRVWLWEPFDILP